WEIRRHGFLDGDRFFCSRTPRFAAPLRRSWQCSILSEQCWNEAPRKGGASMKSDPSARQNQNASSEHVATGVLGVRDRIVQHAHTAESQINAQWARVRGRLRQEYGEAIFRSWLKPLTLA